MQWADLEEAPLLHHSSKTNRFTQRTAWLETCATTGHRLLVLLKAASLGAGRAKGREIVVDLDACTGVFAPSRDPNAKGGGCDINMGAVLAAVDFRAAPEGRPVRLRSLETTQASLMAVAKNARSDEFLRFLIQTLRTREHAEAEADVLAPLSARKHRIAAAAKSSTGKGSRKSLFAVSQDPHGAGKGRMSVHADPMERATSAHAFAEQSGLLAEIDAREWPADTKIALAVSLRIALSRGIFAKKGDAAKPEVFVEIFDAKMRCVWRSTAQRSFAPSWAKFELQLGQLCRAHVDGAAVDLNDPLEFVVHDQKSGKELARLRIPEGTHWLLVHEGCALKMTGPSTSAMTLAIDTCHLLHDSGGENASREADLEAKVRELKGRLEETEAKARELATRLLSAETEAAGYLAELAKIDAERTALSGEVDARTTAHQLAAKRLVSEVAASEEALEEMKAAHAKKVALVKKRVAGGARMRLMRCIVRRVARQRAALGFIGWFRNAAARAHYARVTTKIVRRMVRLKVSAALSTWIAFHCAESRAESDRQRQALVARDTVAREQEARHQRASAMARVVQEQSMRTALSNLREAARPTHFGVDVLQTMHAEVSRLNERSSPAKSRAAAVPAPDAITAQVLVAPAATLSMGLLARDLSATCAEGGSPFLTLSIEVPHQTAATAPAAMCSGWLSTKGPLLKRWRPKFFVLGRDGILFDAPQDGSRAMLHTEPERVTSVEIDAANEGDDADTSEFRVVTNVNNGRTYHFQAVSAAERREWLSAFRGAGWSNVQTDGPSARADLLSAASGEDGTPQKRVAVSVHIDRHGNLDIVSKAKAAAQTSEALTVRDPLNSKGPVTLAGCISDVWRSPFGVDGATDVWGALKLDLDQLSEQLRVDGGAQELLKCAATVSCFALTVTGDQRLRSAVTMPLGDLCGVKPSQPINLRDAHGAVSGTLKVVACDLRDVRVLPVEGCDDTARIITVFDGEVRSDELPSTDEATKALFETADGGPVPEFSFLQALERQFASHLDRHTMLCSNFAAAQSRLALMRSQMLAAASHSSSVLRPQKGSAGVLIGDAKMQVELLRAQAEEMKGLSRVFAYNEEALRTQHAVLERQAAMVTMEQSIRFAEIERREDLQGEVLKKQRLLQQHLITEQRKYQTSAVAANAERLLAERAVAEARSAELERVIAACSETFREMALRRVVRFGAQRAAAKAWSRWLRVTSAGRGEETERLRRAHATVQAASTQRIVAVEAELQLAKLGHASLLATPSPGTQKSVHVSRHGSITVREQPELAQLQLVQRSVGGGGAPSPRRRRGVRGASPGRGANAPPIQSPGRQRRIPVPRVPGSGLGSEPGHPRYESPTKAPI